MPDKTQRKRSSHQKTKGRVLQARIPEQLDDELRTRAEQLGLSVSTIVRNVLLHTFDLVEGVVIDSSQIAKALTSRDTAQSDAAAEPPVIGWQEVVLNKNGVCEQCNAILPAGQRAAIGVPTGSRALMLCQECLSTLSSNGDDLTPGKSGKRPAKRKSSASKGL